MSEAQGTGEPATRREGRAAPASALAGGVVTFATVFVPLAPVVGGAARATSGPATRERVRTSVGAPAS